MDASRAERPGVRPLVHVAAGAFVAASVAVSLLRPPSFGALLGEDALVEWLTVTLYVGAGVPLLVGAVRQRRPFDALVGLFCLFVAGEEMSWGQRLLGYTPPAFFLERNAQQEANLHNFGSARTIFTLAMIGYGIVLPLVARSPRGRGLLERLGATAPPLALLPWFVAVVVLVRWDPYRISGELAECLAAALFFLVPAPGRRAGGRAGWLGWLGAAAAAAALTALSGFRSRADTSRLACAQREAEALAADLAAGALAPAVAAREVALTRVWLMVLRGEATEAGLGRFRSLRCDAGDDGNAERRRFAVDPWGNSFFAGVRPSAAGGREVVVYSFGPDRRRQGTIAGPAGDDVAATARVPDARRPDARRR